MSYEGPYYRPTKRAIQEMLKSMVEAEISEYTDMIVENLEQGSLYPIEPKDHDRVKRDAEKMLLHISNEKRQWF